MKMKIQRQRQRQLSLPLPLPNRTNTGSSLEEVEAAAETKRRNSNKYNGSRIICEKNRVPDRRNDNTVRQSWKALLYRPRRVASSNSYSNSPRYSYSYSTYNLQPHGKETQLRRKQRRTLPVRTDV